MKIGFDNEKYLKIQSEHIRERIAKFDGKLYLELGGKLFDDHHASRVLPGFKPDSKLRMFAQLRDQLEIVIVVSAEDIEKNKVRADLGITYDEDVLRLRQEFQSRDFMVGSVVITHYNGQQAADQFRHRLERLGSKLYVHYRIDGYLVVCLQMERVNHVDIVQVGSSSLVSDVYGMLQWQIPYGESLELSVAGTDAALVLVIELAEADSHLARARTWSGDDDQLARGLYVVILAKSFV